ncbi:MAG TPA: glycosyltransferase family 4 protein [Verrucomicrobiae bacterium]|nr:glycosyltransferase family 4 protein [Verrucomicrobiae bacterium]
MPKFLCITTHDPDSPDRGSVLRVRHLFRLLARLGDVRILLAGSFSPIDESKREFEVVGNIQFGFTGNPSLAHRLRRQFDSRFLEIEGVHVAAGERERLLHLMSRHDMVWVHDVKVANAMGIRRWPKTVLDVDDVPSDFVKTVLPNTPGLIHKLRRLNQFVLWRRHEKTIAERFEALCVCSDADRDKLPGAKKIFVLPNGYEMPGQEPIRNPVMPPRVGFVGTFYYPPNRDGVRWFIENVWPQILENFPDARLRLAGEGSDKQIWNKPNIDALGFVSDLAGEMATWSFSIVPLFAGAGTRIKIADAFSRKCPVVSTRLGAHGYEVRDGRELFIASTPAEFVKRCLRILERPTVGDALAENAWQKFLEKWTWNAHFERVAEIVGAVLNGTNNSHSSSPDFKGPSPSSSFILEDGMQAA